MSRPRLPRDRRWGSEESEIAWSSRSTPSCSRIVPADESGRDQVGDAAVDQRARVEHVEVTPRHTGGARLDPHESEDVLVLRLSQPIPHRPEREVEEHDGRP